MTTRLPAAQSTASVQRRVLIIAILASFVAFLDTNDVWLPRKLEHYIKVKRGW